MHIGVELRSKVTKLKKALVQLKGKVIMDELDSTIRKLMGAGPATFSCPTPLPARRSPKAEDTFKMG